MAKTLEKQTVCAIEQAILTAQKSGRQPDLHAIAAIFSTTYQSVCYIRRRIEKLQRTGIDERKPPGRKPMIEQERMSIAMLELLQKRPELNQSAVSDHLYEQFGKRLSQASISRIYKKTGIPHKISNKLYKKSKLFTTHPDGHVLTRDTSREMAADALSSLTTSINENGDAPTEPLSVNAWQGRQAPNDRPPASDSTFEAAHMLCPATFGLIDNYPSPEMSSGTGYGNPVLPQNGTPYKSPYT